MNTYFSFLNTQMLDEKLKEERFPFSKFLFWDSAIEAIDTAKHKKYIIERVLAKGFLKDIYFLFKMYSTEELTEAIKGSKVLDAKTVNFCSLFFNIPLNELHAAPFYS